MKQARAWIGERLGGLGELALLARETFGAILPGRLRWSDLIYQFYFIGVRSQTVVLITGAFTGMVMCAQTYFQFHKVGMDTATMAVVYQKLLDIDHFQSQ